MRKEAHSQEPRTRRGHHPQMTLQRQQGPGLCSAPEWGSNGKEMGRGPSLYPLPPTSLT